MSKINYYKFIFYFCIFIIVLLSVYPGNIYYPAKIYGGDEVLAESDKSNHYISYFILTIMGFLSYPNSNLFWKLSISLLLLGSFLEILQIWIPNRSFEFLDMLANTSGVVIGLVIIKIFNKIKITKK